MTPAELVMAPKSTDDMKRGAPFCIASPQPGTTQYGRYAICNTCGNSIYKVPGDRQWLHTAPQRSTRGVPPLELVTTFGQCQRCRRVKKYPQVLIVDCAGSNPGIGRVLYDADGKILSCACGGFLAPQDFFNAESNETKGAIGTSVPLVALIGTNEKPLKP